MAFKMFKKGASGGIVKDAQKALAKRLKTKIKGDGKFGPATEEHIKAFQKKSRLKADGLLGPKTLAALMPDTADGKNAALKGQTKLLKKIKSDVSNVRKLKAQYDKELAKLEAGIAKASDDADLGQMMMLQLQATMQKLQKMMQMLSQLMKQQHATTQNIIKNIR